MNGSCAVVVPADGETSPSTISSSTSSRDAWPSSTGPSDSSSATPSPRPRPARSRSSCSAEKSPKSRPDTPIQCAPDMTAAAAAITVVQQAAADTSAHPASAGWLPSNSSRRRSAATAEGDHQPGVPTFRIRSATTSRPVWTRLVPDRLHFGMAPGSSATWTYQSLSLVFGSRPTCHTESDPSSHRHTMSMPRRRARIVQRSVNRESLDASRPNGRTDGTVRQTAVLTARPHRLLHGYVSTADRTQHTGRSARSRAFSPWSRRVLELGTSVVTRSPSEPRFPSARRSSLRASTTKRSARDARDHDR